MLTRFTAEAIGSLIDDVLDMVAIGRDPKQDVLDIVDHFTASEVQYAIKVYAESWVSFPDEYASDQFAKLLAYMGTITSGEIAAYVQQKGSEE